MNFKNDIPTLYLEFSMQLRNEMVWNRETFELLFHQMKHYCENLGDSQHLDRKVAEVFWNASWWVKQQIEGINEFERDYYVNAVTNLDHLAWYLFASHSRAGDEYEPI